MSLALISSRPSDSVYVSVDVRRAVQLNDPIDAGEIDASGRDIRTEEDGRGALRGESVEDF